MQKESTIQFWDEYHEQNGEKEWLIHGTSDLLESIYRNCGSSQDGRLRILEIGCGTSAMARELWKYIEDAESKAQKGRRVLIRSTDVSRVCIDSCFARDRNISNVYGPDDLALEGCGLEYVTLDVQVPPTFEESGQWDAVIDKACMDTFLFRSKSRGDKRNYPMVVLMALETIWRLISDNGVYILISPRRKLKPIRDFAGFSSVEKLEIRPEVKCNILSPKGFRQKDPSDVYFMYICRKNAEYVVGDPNPFRLPLCDMPSDDTRCENCGMSFAALRQKDDPEGRRGIFMLRKWKNHCAYCKV
jgi:hypothetical protein